MLHSGEACFSERGCGSSGIFDILLVFQHTDNDVRWESFRFLLWTLSRNDQDYNIWSTWSYEDAHVNEHDVNVARWHRSTSRETSCGVFVRLRAQGTFFSLFGSIGLFLSLFPEIKFLNDHSFIYMVTNKLRSAPIIHLLAWCVVWPVSDHSLWLFVDGEMLLLIKHNFKKLCWHIQSSAPKVDFGLDENNYRRESSEWVIESRKRHIDVRQSGLLHWRGSCWYWFSVVLSLARLLHKGLDVGIFDILW
jgi:hypothetical protein